MDVTAILNDVKSDLDGDVQLVQTILKDVGVGVDLSGVTGLVNSLITVVSTLVTEVDGLTAGTAVGTLVDDIESDLSTILKGLGKLV